MTSFVLLHGTLIWVAALIAFVAAIYLSLDGLRRARARRWIRGEASSLDLPTSDRVVRGALAGGAASTMIRRHATTHDRAAQLWIVTPAGRIPLVGDIHVIAGSTMRADRRGTCCTVREGDEVIAHGTLERAIDRLEQDYRADPTSFGLRGAPILLTARRPASTVRRLSLRATSLIIAGASQFGYQLEHALGTHWRESCVALRAPIAITSRNACVLAATMPGNTDAPQLLLAALDRGHRNSREDLERRVALATELGDCDHAIYALERGQRWRELVPMAFACHAPAKQQLALAELGRFGEAQAIHVLHGELPALELAIVAEDWTAAANLLEMPRGKMSDPTTAQLERACRVEMFRAWAGDRSAAQRLHELANRFYSPVTRDSFERPPGLWACRAELVEVEEDRAFDIWSELDTWNAGRELPALAAAFDDEAVAQWGLRLWTVEASEPSQNPDQNPWDQLAIADARAIHLALRGDVAGALRAAAAADRFAEERNLAPDDRAPLARQLALLTPATDISIEIPRRGLSWWHQLAHVFLRDGKEFAANLDDGTRWALVQAQGGDARDLAEWIASDRSPLRDFDVMAVLPRIERGRAELLEALRWTAPSTGALRRGFPVTSATRAFTRRALFDLAGDRAAAAPWAQIFERYDTVLSKHRVQLALALARLPRV